MGTTQTEHGPDRAQNPERVDWMDADQMPRGPGRWLVDRKDAHAPGRWSMVCMKDDKQRSLPANGKSRAC